MKIDWDLIELGNCCNIISGGTPKTKVKEYWGNDVMWITPKDMGKATEKFVSSSSRMISSLGLDKSSAKLIPPNSIILSTRAPIGHLLVNTITCSTNQGCRGLVPSDNLDCMFLYYFCLKSVPLFNKLGTGTTFLELSKTVLSKVEIPLPPIEEQKQIVAILDKAFAAIDKAKSNIEKNIENAKELFQSKLNEVFSKKGVGWEEKKLDDVCLVLNGNAFKSKETTDKSKTQLLRMGNLYKNVLDLSRKPVFYPDSYSVKYSDYLLREGDLVMSLTGTVGKRDYGYTVKIPKIERAILLNQRIMKIEVKDAKMLNKDFLKNYLLSPNFLDRLYDTANGTRQANLSSRTILTLKINFPTDLKVQLKIVKQFISLRNDINSVETRYAKKLNSLKELKKSLLQKAFTGELTAKG